MRSICRKNGRKTGVLLPTAAIVHRRLQFKHGQSGMAWLMSYATRSVCSRFNSLDGPSDEHSLESGTRLESDANADHRGEPSRINRFPWFVGRNESPTNSAGRQTVSSGGSAARGCSRVLRGRTGPRIHNPKFPELAQILLSHAVRLGLPVQFNHQGPNRQHSLGVLFQCIAHQDIVSSYFNPTLIPHPFIHQRDTSPFP